MPEYEYGNARLRAMKSRLLSRQTLHDLAGIDSLQGLIAALTRTPYAKSIEAALTRFSGMACIDEALRNDLVASVGCIHGFFHEETRALIALVLRSHDIENLKAILRGLSKNIPSAEIISVLLPIGELKIDVLRELARLNNVREAIDQLASQALPVAAPLVRLRGEQPGAGTFEMELALDRWHYQEAQHALRGEAGEDGILRSAFALDADLANVLTALRFAASPREREALREKFRSDDTRLLFVAGGRIPGATLAAAAATESIPAAVEALAGTMLAPPLRTGSNLFAQTNRLSDLEKALKRHRLVKLSQLIEQDPLGLGVALGYIALKVNEIGNLRWIAHGINMNLPPESILADLEVLP